MKLTLDELRLRDHTAVQSGTIDDGEFTTDARVLVVEDDTSDRQLIERVLAPETIGKTKSRPSRLSPSPHSR